ncbi:hypothetical protein Lesp02_73290 [Lentzea sp. NBRC 105346]|uniref:hypothetical protein n=1 Tax=Lentzea sp. NBRC 105346 TaxID=3032205 RepID=UPI0024A3D862|nr:hypothetical protein [Lentzea sp. NBRC 105346]GLZ35142.1 hypothetical protein Lesp02_73290 [Lentzea sp. NBRC 105346]
MSARTWAVAAGIAGLFANLSLVLFFAIDQPWRPQPYGTGWLGPVNDMLVVIQFALLVPVAVALRRGAAIAVPAMAAVVALQLLLIVGVLSFEVEVIPVVACFAVAVGWAFVVSRRAGLPRPAARLGTAVSVGYLAGLAIVLLALLLPWGSTAQWIVLAVGGLIGIFGYVGFGVWPLWLFKEER